jgi:hypothetical protein
MTRKSVVAALLTVASVVFLLAACKENKKITGPDDPNPGTYTLILQANDTLQYSVDNQNIITVRLYLGETIPAGVRLLWRTESNIGFIDDNDQTIFIQSDTVSFPCGSNPCLDYHCNDTTVAKDAVFAYAVLSTGDTVASTSTGFFLRH